MAMETLTREEALNLFRAHFRNLIPGADVSDFSDYDVMARILAEVFRGNQEQAAYLAKQILPSTAEAEFLEEHAAALGLSREPAARAAGHVMLTGTAGGSQPAGSAITHASGVAYQTVASATLATPGWTGKTVAFGSTRDRIFVSPNVTGISADDTFDIASDGEVLAVRAVLPGVNAIDLWAPRSAAPSSGQALGALAGAVVQIDADESGVEGNQRKTDELTLTSPGTNVDATAVVLELTGGGDIETDDELRQKVLDYKSARPGGGNAPDWRAWARETPDVRLADAFVFFGARGLGTIDVIPWGLSGARQVGEATRAKIEAYVQSKAPFPADWRVVAHGIASPALNVTLTVTCAPGYEADWEGTFTTNTGSTTTRIYLTTDPTGTIEVGHRILVPITSAGKARTVQTTVTAVATTYVDVEAIEAAPASSDVVRPGGPLGQAVIDAVEDFFDGVGPADTIYATGVSTRYPAPDEKWPDTVRVAQIVADVMGLDGAHNVTVSSPASDYAPSTLSLAYTVPELGDLAITFDKLT